MSTFWLGSAFVSWSKIKACTNNWRVQITNGDSLDLSFSTSYCLLKSSVYRILPPQFRLPTWVHSKLFDKTLNRKSMESRFSQWKSAKNEIFNWKQLLVHKIFGFQNLKYFLNVFLAFVIFLVGIPSPDVKSFFHFSNRHGSPSAVLYGFILGIQNLLQSYFKIQYQPLPSELSKKVKKVQYLSLNFLLTFIKNCIIIWTIRFQHYGDTLLSSR